MCLHTVRTSVTAFVFALGDDDGRFLMDRETGEVKLTRGVKDRLTTPELHLQVMVRLTYSVFAVGMKDIPFLTPNINLCLFVACAQAYQDDDPRKYSVATVLVRVLAVNQFFPEFDMAAYHGFVTAGNSPASLVNTYGSKALMLHVQDQDFNQVCTSPHSSHMACVHPQRKNAQSSSVFDLYCYPSPPFSPQIDRVSIPWSPSPSVQHPTTQTSTKSHRRGFWSPGLIDSNQNRNTF